VITMTTEQRTKISKGNPPIQVRHTPELRELWHEAAGQTGVAYSDWVRDTLTAEARRVLGLAAPHPEPAQQIQPDNCPHPGWKPGSSGLTVCKRCGRPKALVLAQSNV
jgi:hypothetical protein